MIAAIYMYINLEIALNGIEHWKYLPFANWGYEYSIQVIFQAFLTIVALDSQ